MQELKKLLPEALRMQILGQSILEAAVKLNVGVADLAKAEMELKEEIQTAISNSAGNFGDLSQRVGVPPLIAYFAVSLYGIKLPQSFYFTGKGRRLRQTRQAVGKDVTPLEEFCKRNHIRLPQSPSPYGDRDRMDMAIAMRCTLKEIGIAGGYAGDNAKKIGWAYLHSSGQHSAWLYGRKEKLANR